MPIPVDNRFPNLLRPSDIPNRDVRVIAVNAARSIVNRTNIGCLYDVEEGEFYFYLPHDIRCGLAIHFPIQDGGRLIRPTPSDIDDIVRLIGMSRASAAEKDKIAAQNAQKEEWKNQDQMNNHLAERRPDALQRAEYFRVQRQMGKYFHKGAVVDGLKGAKH